MHDNLKQQFYKGNHVNYIFTVITLIFGSACMIAVSVILQMLVDIASDGTMHQLYEMLIACGIYIVVYGMVLYGKKIFINRYIKKAMAQYKSFVFKKILEKNINTFNSEPQSTFISAMTNDMKMIQNGYLLNGIQIILQISLLTGGILAMAYYNIPLLIITLLLCGFQIVISILCSGKLAAYEKKLSDSNAKFVALVKDLLTGFSVIKSFKAENQTQRMFDRMNDHVEETAKQRSETADNIQMISALGETIITLIIFLSGVYFAIQGKITPGVVIGFVQLLNFVTSPISVLSEAVANHKSAKMLIQKMESLISNTEITSEKKKLTAFEQEIKYRNVSFRYDENSNNIIKNIDLSFQKNKKYAIVGGSGSGKSTLLNLLLGYSKKYEGEILIDQCELHDVSIDSVYDFISVIQQNVFIFDASIKDNITLFDKFEEAVLDKVIKQAGLDQLIEKKGWNYACGENGCNLSGGEKQRISIARCLLRNTPIILMDEATSALDFNTSLMIEKEILNLDQSTRIIITHKLQEEILKQYDCIIALNNGRVVEQGTFDELMDHKQYFYSLFMISK